MNAQCGTCGSFGTVGGLFTCQHCGAPLCAQCKAGHESVCRELSKQRAMGLGRTVVPLGVRAAQPAPPTPENPPVYPAVVNTSIQPTDPFAAAGIAEFTVVEAAEAELEKVKPILAEFVKAHPEVALTPEASALLAAHAPEGSATKALLDPLGLITADAEGHPVATGVEPPAPAPTSPEPVVENSNTLNDGHTTTV